MKNTTKAKIIVYALICYAISKLILSFISYAFISEGETIGAVLMDNDGRSALFQSFFSLGMVIFGFLLVSFKRWALKVMNSLLLLSFINILLATFLSDRFRLVDILNPFLWIPLIIFIILNRTRIKSQFK